MPSGGKRAGAGGPRGPRPNTLDKIAARELVRKIVTEELTPLVRAQIANATGLKYLVVRDKATGKFLRVGEALARASTEETIEVWEKDPSTEAFSRLMDRALDQAAKPAEQMSVTGKLVIGWDIGPAKE